VRERTIGYKIVLDDDLTVLVLAKAFKPSKEHVNTTTCSYHRSVANNILHVSHEAYQLHLQRQVTSW
jgi:hypothetical protein